MFSIDGRIRSCKRRYRQALKDMLVVIQGEIESLESDSPELSSAINSGAIHIVQEYNRLQALLEVEKDNNPCPNYPQPNKA